MNPRKKISMFDGKLSLRNVIKYHRWIWWRLAMDGGNNADKIALFKSVCCIEKGPTCFPCQMVLSNKDNRGSCDFCPVNWSAIGKSKTCECNDGLWMTWVYEENSEKRKEMAALICSIPVKKWNYGKYSW